VRGRGIGGISGSSGPISGAGRQFVRLRSYIDRR
jgi:hypothetical protein